MQIVRTFMVLVIVWSAALTTSAGGICQIVFQRDSQPPTEALVQGVIDQDPPNLVEAARSRLRSHWGQLMFPFASEHTNSGVLTVNIDASHPIDWLHLKKAMAYGLTFGVPIFPDGVYKVIFKIVNQAPEQTSQIELLIPPALGMLGPRAYFERHGDSYSPLSGSLLERLWQVEDANIFAAAEQKLMELGFQPQDPILQGMQGKVHWLALLLGLGYAYHPWDPSNLHFVKVEKEAQIQVMELMLLTTYKNYLPHQILHPSDIAPWGERYLEAFRVTAEAFLRLSQTHDYNLIPFSWQETLGGRPVGFLTNDDLISHYGGRPYPPAGAWWLKTGLLRGLSVPMEWAAGVELAQNLGLIHLPPPGTH